jgi:uncharacterized protein (DUF433 family)
MLVLKPQPVPLREAEDGTWRAGNTRVLFDLVVYAFNNGRTPEEIVQSFDTLQLEDVYAVLAYYLANRSEVDAYLKEQEQESESQWQEIKDRPDYREFREKLLSRRSSAQQ